MSGPLSRTDTDPAPIPSAQTPTGPTFERYESRSTEVGGTPVRRALPKRPRRTIGAWCFIDHFGPVAAAGAHMSIGPHPHIGIQTVTWLLAGELLHADSLGSEQLIRPGECNLMTAGNGVAHAEETRGHGEPQHGAQLWIAQPDATRHGAAAFQHLPDLPHMELGCAGATILLGECIGARSPARTDTPLIGMALEGLGTGAAEVPLDPAFEYGLVVLDGEVALGNEPVRPGELVYLGRGRDELALGVTEMSRALLVGGEPMAEPLLMWWNFVARSREEIDTARHDWNAETDRFGAVASTLDRIAAPDQ